MIVAQVLPRGADVGAAVERLQRDPAARGRQLVRARAARARAAAGAARRRARHAHLRRSRSVALRRPLLDIEAVLELQKTNKKYNRVFEKVFFTAMSEITGPAFFKQQFSQL